MTSSDDLKRLFSPETMWHRIRHASLGLEFTTKSHNAEALAETGPDRGRREWPGCMMVGSLLNIEAA